LQRIVDSAGRLIQLQTDRDGRIVSIHLPVPIGADETFPVVSYQYDAQGELVAAYDAYRIPRRYAYRDHLLVEERDRNGLAFTFSYARFEDGYRCIETSGPGRLYMRSLAYDANAKQTTVTDSLGGVTKHSSNDLGVVVETVDPLGHKTTFEYDEQARLIAETNALGQQRTVQHDELGRRTLTTGFDGLGATIAWSAHGRERTITDRKGLPWISRYDEAGRLIEKIEPTGIVETLNYDSGLLKEIADTSGRRRTYEYDHHYDIRVLLTSSGSRIEWRYDQLGRQIEARDEAGNTLRRTYDLCGRITSVEEPDGNIRRYAYDGEGNIVGVRDSTGDVQLEFFGTGRLAAVHQAGRSTRYTYDTEERLTGIQDSKAGDWHFRRDAAGNVIEEQTPTRLRLTYVRDALGRVIEKHWPSGRLARYAYTPLGQVASVSFTDGTVKKFAYNSAGELAAADDGRVAIEFERDARGSVIQERVGDRSLKLKRDLRGLVTEVKTSEGLFFTREWDGASDRLNARIGSLELSVHTFRDSAGLVTRRDFPAGARLQISRNSLGLPEAQSLVAANVHHIDRRYQWDRTGQLTSTADRRVSRRFERDEQGRLLRKRAPGTGPCRSARPRGCPTAQPRPLVMNSVRMMLMAG
jgi:YD repeat-containing protein